MPRQAHFTAAAFRFLRELRAHNSRDWFQANRQRYEAEVRDPLIRFVADAAPHLLRISPHIVADPRPVGGSVFRIHRDTRFSKDKSPYKTNAGAYFHHTAGKNVHAPGYYLHLEPGNVFVGTGVWQPDGENLRKIRDAIVEHPEVWKRIVSARSFRSACPLEGEVLARPPRGYDPDHPLIEDLRRKDFTTMTPFTEAQACAPGFLDQFVKVCRAAEPMMRFLAGAIGVGW